MKRDEYIAAPQVPVSQYWSGYDSTKRWSSYWIQIERALSIPEGPILEIGVGNGLVAEYLRRIGNKEVITLDIDPGLEPDVVADIAELPFPDDAFQCVMACEVLEHLPFERSLLALREMRRVARHGIVSVPNNGWCAQISFSTRYRNRTFRLSAPWFRRPHKPVVPKEHYWELEMSGYPEKRFRDAVIGAGWQIERDMRNPNNPFHHFFFLE